ncbi:PLP-dependent transferase [Kocuria sp. NPDC057446]|uniref:PLP-dependent transferase n=1 Tax=Kocuria sp. NPDC057446 TaxID=3346137 RepID=UPI00369973EC
MTLLNDTAQTDTAPTARRGFNTIAVAGQAPDPLTGAVVPPMYQTSTFVQDGINVLRGGHEYSRGSNPTRTGQRRVTAAARAARRPGSTSSGQRRGCQEHD